MRRRVLVVMTYTICSLGVFCHFCENPCRMAGGVWRVRLLYEWHIFASDRCLGYPTLGSSDYQRINICDELSRALGCFKRLVILCKDTHTNCSPVTSTPSSERIHYSRTKFNQQLIKRGEASSHPYCSARYCTKVMQSRRMDEWIPLHRHVLRTPS
jgi:hypothetical protein